MTIRNKLSQDDFVRASLSLLMKKKITIGILIFFGISLVASTFLVFYNPDAVQLSNFIFPVIIPAFYFGSVYYQATRYYKTNPLFSQETEYIFSDKNFSAKGDTFSNEFAWEGISKVTKDKNWVYIWTSTRSAHVLPTRLFSADALLELKSILAWNHVNNNL